MTLAKGVDVSHWNTLSDWNPVGLSFVIAKASEGGVPDPMYGSHIGKAQNHGLVTGAYCFNRADLPMQYQVDAFIRAAGEVDLYAIDVEEESIAGTQRFSMTQARDFMARFRASSGKRIGMYISESPYVSGGYSQARADWIWIAHYGVDHPSVRWDFHQWTSNSGALDEDRFNGTAAELRAFAGIPPAPPSDIAEPSMIVPQALGHVVVTAAQARIYENPDASLTPIASTLAKGTGARFVAAVSGWRYCELVLGGKTMYGWLRADETDDTAEPLTLIDGAPDCSAAIATATATLQAGLKVETARANAAEGRVSNARVALGCAP